MKNIFVLAFFLTLFNGLLAQLVETPLNLETKTGVIYGTLINPDQTKTSPLVIVIAGSGPTDRNGNNPMMSNNSLKMLAEGLAESGISSLRYDKRGVAESKEAGLKEEELRFENYVEDAKAWVEMMSKDSLYSEIIVMGHSEGSLIGMIAAESAQVSKFVSLAGTGIPAGDILRGQLKKQSPFVFALTDPIITDLENGKTVDSISPMLMSLFRPSVQPYLISWFGYDPKIEIAKLNKPICIIQGTTDIQVDTWNADSLANGNINAQKFVVEGMNHVLKEAEMDRAKNIETYNKPELPLKKEVLPIISRFILQE